MDIGKRWDGCDRIRVLVGIQYPSPVEQRERERERELEERSLAGVIERLIRVEHLADPGKESKICQARYLALMRSVPLPRDPGGRI